MARKRPSRGSRHTVEATGLTAHGEGTASLGRDELVVADLLPGERAEVVITHVGQRLFGRVVQREVSDRGRRPAPCPQHGQCQGCPLMTVDEARQRHFKRAWLQRYGLQVDAIEHDDRPLGYRWSSKRVVGGVPGALVLGSFRRRSHEVADMDDCRVDHPLLSAVCTEVVVAANELGLPPYSPEEPAGLRYLWLKTNGEQTLVTLIAGTATPKLRELAVRIDATVVAVGQQSDHGNAIAVETLEVVVGPAAVPLNLADRQTEIGPMGFLQPNPPVAERAYQHLVDAPAGERALDLYAGAGVTTALLRDRFTTVIPCESHPASAAALGVEPSRAEDFLASQRESVDLIVANPPRSGMGDHVCEHLGRLGPARIHVMSCHPRSLATDLGRLGAHGYEVTDLRAYDTLPQTMHIELVVHLVKRTARLEPGAA